MERMTANKTLTIMIIKGYTDIKRGPVGAVAGVLLLLLAGALYRYASAMMGWSGFDDVLDFQITMVFRGGWANLFGWATALALVIHTIRCACRREQDDHVLSMFYTIALAQFCVFLVCCVFSGYWASVVSAAGSVDLQRALAASFATVQHWYWSEVLVAGSCVAAMVIRTGRTPRISLGFMLAFTAVNVAALFVPLAMMIKISLK